MSTEEPTSKDVIPNMELILIFIFFAAFIVWAVSKCSVTQAKYEEEASVGQQENTEQIDSTKEATTTQPPPTTTATKTQIINKEVSVLYVILDELKLRKGPTRDSAIIKQLQLNEKVYFLNEVTSFRERINLGDRVAYEPWIKVRAKSGHEGWVYGAGLHYHTQKFVEPVEVIQEEGF